jgi:hypothetical protein
MIAFFKDAWKKGLEAEDYDASRWDCQLLTFVTPVQSSLLLF